MAPIKLQFGPGSSPGDLGLDGSARVINAYADPLVNGKSDYVMRATPGLRAWSKPDNAGPWRGWLDVGGRLLAVLGNALFEFDVLGNAIEVGGIPGTGRVSMAANALADPDVMIVADGQPFHWKAGTLTPFETDVLPTLVGVVYMRGRFVFAAADGRFFYSNINSLLIDGDAFYTAEGMPDGLVAVAVLGQELYLIGPLSIEKWGATTDDDDPFGALGGGALSIGCAAPNAVVTIAGRLIWIDDNNTVQVLTGSQPGDGSPEWIGKLIEAERDKTAIIGTGYAIGGTIWYEISSPSWTLRYNIKRGQWQHRETIGRKRWRGQGAIQYADVLLSGDSETGQVWVQDPDCVMDGDDPVVMRLVSPLIHASPATLAVYSLHADIITGVGGISDDPEVSDPKAMLRISRDGGRSWSRPIAKPIGKQGQIRRVIWRQLGMFERHGGTFELSISSKVAKCVGECLINGTAGSG